MTHELEPIFRDLGLSQYLDTFVDQGFDCWETILDIQESDLDALGVKLGHRRKLQRRIANARGIAPSISLGTSNKTNAEDAKQDTPRPEQSRSEHTPHSHNTHQDGAGVVKRKYRRHPKPDENAPERPPSAYVLFSNKMREDLKSQNLTFTEIAKLVGENWQNLPAAEKEVFESQANTAKEKYHRDLVEYKKTPEYRKYSLYLHEFKERQARHNQDGNKRARLEPGRLRHGSSSSSITPGGSTTTGSGNGSGSERLQGSEPSPTRKQRGNSTASLTESQHSSTAPTPLPQRHSLDELSPRTAHFDPIISKDAGQDHMSSWNEASANGPRHLPSLSDVLDDSSMSAPASASLDSRPYSGFVAANHRRPILDAPSGTSPRRIPHLHHEVSSGGSSGTVSSVSSGSFSRNGDATLPLHALLSRNTSTTTIPSPYEGSPSLQPLKGPATATMPAKPIYNHGNAPRGYGSGFQSTSSAFQDMKVEMSDDGDIVMTSDDATHSSRPSNMKGRFDGMSALLRAGELVSRHNHS
ncbi:hypothetical protein B0I35DRAFT_26321 [Stachybotrys elegans]|uniref:HMG box domain-containing protein n=1 Tax=Stachybotrys elegans TaxID=80388 RepID=A0A8K0T4P0_9HYPO|nr:hypothetical protein B0I35DRAFT_26321 [Stachybotrys elegans]